ncbi:pimeloyl-ACP methyl ester carboxylesterase [Deinobacterium chartae]|uniref:Pimeloyl-ACP methyl ester carboxylesterase n=1 Tax=Deinobacterium chartae TaxID=521158 RepID=A0A841I6E7_9DEIO|nr:alpha/beta fold hydrolase [Deinobacterium chartae]MBB6099472.1 pimeloyl-ACP methyl ester carboxylesterase [Deinobacterium chartae]
MQVTVHAPQRQAAVRLPDGRSFAWSEWGPAGGLAVLFCTGAAMSGSLGFAADHLEALNLRLIAPDRPGLGASSPHPDKTLESWTDDVRTLLEDQGIRQAAAVGFSQGAPFAFALAAHGLVQALAIVSGQDDFGDVRVARRLHPDVVGMVAAARQDPGGFARGFAQMADPDGLWKLIMNMSSERDRALYLEPAFSAAYRRSLEEGFAQGPQGYARDLVNALSAWPFRLEDLRVPVDLWYGAQDASTVHSPDFGRTLAQRLPQAWHHLEPLEGGSLLWTRAHDILARLRSHLVALAV